MRKLDPLEIELGEDEFYIRNAPLDYLEYLLIHDKDLTTRMKKRLIEEIKKVVLEQGSATPKFKVGDKVKWYCQSMGRGSIHVGEVVDVIPPGVANSSITRPRKEESYVVFAKGGKHYPWAKQLRKVI